MSIDDCFGCGAALRDTDLDCVYCRRPNPFARAGQAVMAIEVTQLDDYAPRFVFVTPNEAREFASMWAREHSRPGAIIPLPTGFELTPAEEAQIWKKQQGSPSLLSRLITRIFR